MERFLRFRIVRVENMLVDASGKTSPEGARGSSGGIGEDGKKKVG